MQSVMKNSTVFSLKVHQLSLAWHGFKPMMESIWFDRGRGKDDVHIHGYEENGDITTPF